MRIVWLYGFGAWPISMHGMDMIITFGVGWIVDGHLAGIAFMKRVTT